MTADTSPRPLDRMELGDILSNLYGVRTGLLASRGIAAGNAQAVALIDAVGVAVADAIRAFMAADQQGRM